MYFIISKIYSKSSVENSELCLHPKGKNVRTNNPQLIVKANFQLLNDDQ